MPNGNYKNLIWNFAFGITKLGFFILEFRCLIQYIFNPNLKFFSNWVEKKFLGTN